MKTIYLSIILLLVPPSVFAASANNNHFSMMPHKRIMELNAEACETDALSTGNTGAAQECIEYQQKALGRLFEIYNKYSVATPSWSLCIGEAKREYSYDYLVLLACMKVVKSICKENPNGTWVNPGQCTNGIESGLWINNPKVYEPLDKVFAEK